MLQRAASNAYSWWVAGHIRTKQSKWLEQSLQDMEEKVSEVVKLLTEDGDSFAKRAEMYYKKRPELLSFVEETFRAYRGLAERYDHLSKELQNANNTLASAFPDQFEYMMDDDDDDESTKVPRKGMYNPNANTNTNTPSVPKHFPTKNIRAIMALASKSNMNGQTTPKKAGRRPGNKAVEALRSGFDKTQAVEEIDKLQKIILTKQTEKEFTKSSYETGVAKYMEIEKEITEMQQKVSALQDEFGVGKVIKDNEARTLMLESALKSCQDTLAELQEKQAKSNADAKEERERIKNAQDQILSLRRKLQMSQTETTDTGAAGMPIRDENWEKNDDKTNTTNQAKEIEMLRNKMKEHFEGDSSLSVPGMVENIDELVNKVITLESAVSSQTALIARMRTESDELQTHIQSLEDDKTNLIDGRNALIEKLKETEQKLRGLQEMDRKVERRNISLQTQFIEASSNLDVISQKLPDLIQDEDIEESITTQQESRAISSPRRVGVPVFQQKEPTTSGQVETNDLPTRSQASEKFEESRGKSPPMEAAVPMIQQEQHTKSRASVKLEESRDMSSPTRVGVPVFQEKEYTASDQVKTNDLQTRSQASVKFEESRNQSTPMEDAVPMIQQEYTKSQASVKTEESKDKSLPIVGVPIIQQQQHTSIEQSEKPRNDFQASASEKGKQGEDEPNWQKEYITILQNYKEIKKKLVEVEHKSKDSLTELNELRNVIVKKDEEIQSLQQKLIILQNKLEEYKNMKDTREDHNHNCSLENCNCNNKDDVIIKLVHVKEQREMSPAEAKLRAEIDAILEENLDFWIRFSSSLAEVQKFHSQVEDLQNDLAKVEESKKSEVSSEAGLSLKLDGKAIYKHMKEIQTDLSVWLDQTMGLKDELKSRCSELSNVQDAITKALNEGAIDDEMKFTSLQAAKFQGEVLNMQQENNRVADELQAGLDNATNLQIDIERTVYRLNEELGLSGSKRQTDDNRSETGGTKAHIPLHSFIFGVKPKKQKPSFFSCVHPAFHRKYQHLK